MKQNVGRKELIEAIHDSDLRLSLAITGGGSGLISELLSCPGASRTVLQATVPYSRESLTEFLGRLPDRFCAPETSQMLAVQAYFNSIRTHGHGVTAIGSTAALASSQPKKGKHCFYKSIQTEDDITVVHFEFEKNLRSRAQEEDLMVELGLAEIATRVGIQYEPTGLGPHDRIQRFHFQAETDWQDVFHGRRPYCHAYQTDVRPPSNSGVLAGSFNPLHEGHLQMAEIVEKRFGLPVHYELAIRNADKPPIDYLTIRNRLEQFQGQSVWLSAAATFAEKSRLFPGNLFVVGLDTIVRISDDRYYPDQNGLREAIREIRRNNCRFVVFGRLEGSRFLELSDAQIDAELLELCEPVSGKHFRNDVSSTLMRGLKQTEDFFEFPG